MALVILFEHFLSFTYKFPTLRGLLNPFLLYGLASTSITLRIEL